MLIYLTEGKNENGCLNIFQDADSWTPTEKLKESISEINKMDCIIFNQQYEHEGNPYINGDKIFIRTELIFNYDDSLNNNYDYGDGNIESEISNMFFQACYFSINPINNYTNIYTNKLFSLSSFKRMNPNAIVNASRDIKRLLIVKKYIDVYYATDGVKYYFTYHNYDIKRNSLIVLLDQLKGKIIYDNCDTITETQTISIIINANNVKDLVSDEIQNLEKDDELEMDKEDTEDKEDKEDTIETQNIQDSEIFSILNKYRNKKEKYARSHDHTIKEFDSI